MKDPSKKWNTMEVRNMFPRKMGSSAKRQTLFFLRCFWKVYISYEQVNKYQGLTIDITKGIIKNEKINKPVIILDNINGRQLGLIIPENNQRYNEREIYNLVLENYPDKTIEEIKEIKEATKNLTAAAYKSLLQKIIRYKAKLVKINEKLYPSGFVLLVTLGLLILNPGSFVPDIQRYVTGLESFCKRLVVTILEDSYVEESNYPQLVSLLSSALLIQRVKSWKPTIELFRQWFKLALLALNENRYFNYKFEETKIIILNDAIKRGPLALLSVLLDEIKSFKSDLNMARQIANNNGSYGESRFNDYPEIMPIEHIVDQHWAPDILYYYPYELIKEYRTFGDIFTDIFKRVTGVNSRKEQIKNDNFVITTRKAQYLTLKALHINQTALEKLKEPLVNFKFEVNKSWIAGLVGPIEISGKVTSLVTLKPDDLQQLVVIRKPSRDMKEPQLTDEQYERAIEMTRKTLMKGIALNKIHPPLPSLENAQLIMDGEGNYQIRKDNQLTTIDELIQYNIDICHNETKELIIESAINYYGDGMIVNAQEILDSLIAQTPVNVLRRVIMYLSNHRHELELNRLSRDGSGIEQPVMIEDIGAFHFLIKLSLIYPLALRKLPTSLIKFRVTFGPLLWLLRDYINMTINQQIEWDNKQWGNIGDNKERQPWQHQIECINDMINRKKKGHFIWIPVGMGKTYIVLRYLQYLKEGNKLPNYIIYSLPDSAISSIVQEIIAFGFKVAILNPTQKVSRPYITKEILPYTITLIEHDHLRLTKQLLTPIINSAIVIVDEVHKTLNDTLRTSAALELSHLALDFVVMTGTPVIDTKIYKLIHWLEQIVDFEVNEQNFWVVANSMIAKKASTGVKVIREEIETNFTEDELTLYRQLVSPNLGGKNTASSVNDFNKAIELCYQTVTREIIKQVQYQLIIDKGAMVVARNESHQMQIYTLLIEKGIVNASDIFLIKRGQSIHLSDETINNQQVPDYKVVIVPINRSEGYTLTRYQTMITSVYPSNNATREQIEGRINRSTQKSAEVTFKIIHIGLLTFILRRHKDARNLNEVLKTLASEITSF